MVAVSVAVTMASYWAVLFTHPIHFLFLLIYVLSARLMGRVGLASHTQKPTFNRLGHCQVSEYEQRGGGSHQPSLSLLCSRSNSDRKEATSVGAFRPFSGWTLRTDSPVRGAQQKVPLAESGSHSLRPWLSRTCSLQGTVQPLLPALRVQRPIA